MYLLKVLDQEDKKALGRTLLFFEDLWGRNFDYYLAFHDDVEKFTCVAIVKDVFIGLELLKAQVSVQIENGLLAN